MNKKFDLDKYYTPYDVVEHVVGVVKDVVGVEWDYVIEPSAGGGEMSDYKDDNVWLMKGDCLDRMKEIPKGNVDLVLTDPPFATTKLRWDSIIPLDEMWESLKLLCDKYIILTSGQPFTTKVINSNINNFKYELIWQKTRNSHPFFAKQRPLPAHESILVFSFTNGWHTYIPQMDYSKGEHIVNKNSSGRTHGENRGKKWDGTKEIRKGRYPTSVITISNPSGEMGLHPTQMPVGLMEYLIKTYTNEGDTVLDFTFGSGTTGVACRNLNRKFIGIEMDDRYFDIAKERILSS